MPITSKNGGEPTQSAPERVGVSRERRTTATDLALIASFAALIAVAGQVGMQVPVAQGVPITLQTLAVMLAGLVLGARRGALAAFLLAALAAIGLPILFGGRGGLGVFAGPTAGFVLGWIPGAYVTGWFAQRRSTNWWLPLFVGAVLGGVVVVHAFGIPWMAWRAQLSLPAAFAADAIFIPFDLIKAVVAVMVAIAVHKAVPELLPVRRSRFVQSTEKVAGSPKDRS